MFIERNKRQKIIGLWWEWW